ncbi:MAG: alpha/beta hydrolase [Pseudomonadota bacterium]
MIQPSATKPLHLITPSAEQIEQQWQALKARADRVTQTFSGQYSLKQFDYVQPEQLQNGVPERLQKRYSVPVSYVAWGSPDKPVLLCCGGIANTAMRFSFLAAALHKEFYVICMDWLGRGRSGWLAHECEYNHATLLEQMRQMVRHLGTSRPLNLLGSSLGGNIAIDFAAQHEHLVERLILNDIGPFIHHQRRQRRAEVLSRFHVFSNPEDMTRRIGAAQKNDGPIDEETRLFVAWQQTRWSTENRGRIYRYDMRSMQAYRRDAAENLDQWAAWQQIKCPVFLVHGMESDALTTDTIERMRAHQNIEIMHVPDTGHTPTLCDQNQLHFIHHWLLDKATSRSEYTSLHHHPNPLKRAL